MNIAIPLSLERSDIRNYFINEAYLKFIRNAGYFPIPITPYQQMPDCDGLLLPGGIDIDPIYYGYDNRYSKHIDSNRDKFERNLLHYFISKKKPIYGICRGFQLIFLEFCKKYPNNSFSYTQHIDGHNQNELKLERSNTSHFVKFKDSSKAVNSLHHQACLIKTNASSKRLIPIATTTRNSPQGYKIIEAFKIPEWNVKAVQWHPEEMDDIWMGFTES